jgi:hypothetical protein
MPGEGLTHGPPATKKAGGSHHRCSRSSGIPCAMFYGLYALSLGTGLFAPSANRERFAQGLSTGRPGPHDFAVLIKAVRRTAQRGHRFPASRVVTIAIRPSCRGGMTRAKHKF